MGLEGRGEGGAWLGADLYTLAFRRFRSHAKIDAVRR